MRRATPKTNPRTSNNGSFRKNSWTLKALKNINSRILLRPNNSTRDNSKGSSSTHQFSVGEGKGANLFLRTMNTIERKTTEKKRVFKDKFLSGATKKLFKTYNRIPTQNNEENSLKVKGLLRQKDLFNKIKNAKIKSFKSKQISSRIRLLHLRGKYAKRYLGFGLTPKDCHPLEIVTFSAAKIITRTPLVWEQITTEQTKLLAMYYYFTVLIYGDINDFDKFDQIVRDYDNHDCFEDFRIRVDNIAKSSLISSLEASNYIYTFLAKEKSFEDDCIAVFDKIVGKGSNETPDNLLKNISSKLNLKMSIIDFANPSEKEMVYRSQGLSTARDVSILLTHGSCKEERFVSIMITDPMINSQRTQKRCRIHNPRSTSSDFMSINKRLRRCMSGEKKPRSTSKLGKWQGPKMQSIYNKDYFPVDSSRSSSRSPKLNMDSLSLLSDILPKVSTSYRISLGNDAALESLFSESGLLCEMMDATTQNLVWAQSENEVN